MQITYKGQSSWVFVYIWLIILLFSSHLTVPWTLSKMHVQLFSKIDPTTEASRSMSILIMRWGLLPFWSPRSLPAPVQTGKSSWTSGVSTLSLLFSRAQLLPLALSLECLGENKGRLTPLDKYQLSSPGPIHLLPQLKQQKYIISQFWRLEVQQQVVKRSGFFWGLSSSLWLLVFCVFPWTSYVWASVS